MLSIAAIGRYHSTRNMDKVNHFSYEKNPSFLSPYEHWGPNGPQKTGNVSKFETVLGLRSANQLLGSVFRVLPSFWMSGNQTNKYQIPVLSQ